MHKHILTIITICSTILLSGLVAGAATYNVVDYGAVPNGPEANAATNVAAFIDALAAAHDGDTVYVPAGLYYMDAAVSLGVDNLILDGYGATLKRVSSAHPSGYMSLLRMSGSTGVVIQGLTIDGNRTTMVSSVSFGIRDDYANHLTIKDCIIKNCESDGIFLSNEVAEVTIDNCQIMDNHRQGIAITDSAGKCVIEDCTFSGNDGAGIDIEPNWRHTEGHIIRNCTFDGSAGGVLGAQLYGTGYGAMPWSVLIDDCDFINGGGLRLENAMKTQLVNNTFDAASPLIVNGYHQDTYSVGAVTLTGNTIAIAPAGTGNLLTNGSLDNWSGGIPVGWTSQGSGVIESAGPYALAGAAAKISASSGTATLAQDIAVTANAYYTLGGYISRGESDPWHAPSLTITLYDAAMSAVKTIELRAYYVLQQYAAYEKVMAIFQAPADATTARITIGSSAAADFDACFDELFLLEGIGPDNGDLTADDQVLRFDFGPADYYAHADHIAVTPEIRYDEPNTIPAGDLVYGVFNNHTTDPVTGAFKGSAGGWSRFSSSDLTLTSLWFPDEAPWGVSGFQVDLPNGAYYVTLGAGNAGWDSWLRLYLEGRTFSATVDPDNLYILDVAPDKVAGTSDGYLNWELYKNLDLHYPATSYGYVKTWGANNQHPNYADYAEILYLKKQIIDVTDGNLTVYGAAVSGQGFHLNFLEIAPVPPVDCAAVITQGHRLAADANADCQVDLLDLSIMLHSWLKCFDPSEPQCQAPWLD